MATEREIKKRIKDLQVSITAAKKAANDPSNPNREYAQRQLDKFNKEIKDLQSTTPEEDPSEKAIREAQIRLTGKEKGTKPIPPGTFTPQVGPNAIAKPGAITKTPIATPAATPAATGTGVTKPAAKKKAVAPSAPDKAKPANIDEIFALVQSQYGPVDAIFKEDPDLKALMIAATKGTASTKDDYTPQRFLNELQTTTWWAKNSGPIRQRQFYKKQYEDLLKKGGNAEELAQTTEYGRGLGETKQIIADEAVKRGASLDATDLDMLATQVYDLANETSGSIVGAAVRGKIKYTPGAALGGAAGVSLTELQQTASANGLDLNKQFGSNLQGWLQKIAQGESTETYKQIIRDTAKIGLPDRVASLIDKGIDLETIYNPYRNMMAATLEVNPETIKLNDPTLRMAIGPDKEMSLYDYQRSLRKDARWQYTDNARQDVSSIARTVLKDFGFQG